MSSGALCLALVLLFLQCVHGAPAFAQAKVRVGGVELESEAGVSGVLGASTTVSERRSMKTTRAKFGMQKPE